MAVASLQGENLCLYFVGNLSKETKIKIKLRDNEITEQLYPDPYASHREHEGRREEGSVGDSSLTIHLVEADSLSLCLLR